MDKRNNEVRSGGERGRALCRRGALDERLDAFLKFAARQKHAALTAEANHADVCAETHHLPVIVSAWMRFA